MAAILLAVKHFSQAGSLRALLLLSVSVLAAPGLRAAETAPPGTPPGAAAGETSIAGVAGIAGASAASYEFAVGKLLALEGSVDEAIEAFDRALKLAPKPTDAAYILLEEAQLLSRRAQYGRNPAARQTDLRRAAERLAEGRRIAPENLDVLRAIGSVHLDLAASGDAAGVETAREAFEAVLKREPNDVEAGVSLGRIYLDQDQPAKAADLLRDLVDKVPQERMAYALLVESLLRSNRSAEAEKALTEILSFDPRSLEARLTLADLQGKRGDAKAVIATLLAAPEEARGDMRLRRQLAWAFYQTGELQEALRAADALVSRDPNEPALKLLRGLILAADGRNEAALAELEKIQAAQPKDSALLLTISRVLERLGRREEAAGRLLAFADKLSAGGAAGEARELRIEAAQLYSGQKDWNRALETLSPLLDNQDDPTRLQAHLMSADALAELGRVDEALAQLSREASSPATEAKKGEILLKAGRGAEGEPVLAALAAQPEIGAQVAAAQVYQRLERYSDSIPILQQVVAKQANLPIPAFLLAAGLERAGRREEAVTELRQVLKLDPNFHAALNYLGYTFAEAGEHLDEALGLVQRAVALDPDNGSYVDSLGWTYYRLGRHEDARACLERAARLEPEDATLQEHLGDVYSALGQADQARRAYARSIDLDPKKSDELRRKLGALDAKPR